MSQPLKILIVDDNPQDRALVRRVLGKEFPGTVVREVIDQAQLDRALEEARFDVVITDYQLCWTNGIEVLRQVRTRHGDCPVLMFTATGSEEIAVEAMKRGLDDYILKSPAHLVRLQAAVRAALEHAHVRRRASDLECRLDLLLRRLNVGVFRCTGDGRLLEANAPALAFLGAESLDAARAAGLQCLVHRCDGCLKLIAQAWQSGRPQEGDVTLREGGEEPVYYHVSLVPVRTAGDETVLDGLLEDITQRRRSETEARRAAVAAARMALLSPREREVMRAVVAGKANKIIARDLAISDKTVEKHRANVMKKLQAKSVPELVRLALAAESATQTPC